MALIEYDIHYKNGKGHVSYKVVEVDPGDHAVDRVSVAVVLVTLAADPGERPDEPAAVGRVAASFDIPASSPQSDGSSAAAKAIP